MPLYSYNHNGFDRYAEDHTNAVFNIAIVLRLLANKPLTVSQLSEIINTPERKEKGRTTYDLYALIRNMERWCYVKREKNIRKFNSSYEFCVLTKEGQELLAIMPTYIHSLRVKCDYIYEYIKTS